MLDAPLAIKIEEFRKKEREGLLTMEDMKEVVRLYREGRYAASQSRATTRKQQENAIDTDALLGELGDLK